MIAYAGPALSLPVHQPTRRPVCRPGLGSPGWGAHTESVAESVAESGTEPDTEPDTELDAEAHREVRKEAWGQSVASESLRAEQRLGGRRCRRSLWVSVHGRWSGCGASHARACGRRLGPDSCCSRCCSCGGLGDALECSNHHHPDNPWLRVMGPQNGSG